MPAPTRDLFAAVPLELYDMYAKLCITLGITKKEGIIQYLKFLKKQHHHRRKLLSDKSNPTTFELGTTDPIELSE
jgi:hypothetical protein